MYQIQRAASRVICRVLQGRNLDQSLDIELRADARLSRQQRGALQDLSYGTLRFYGQLRAIMALLLHRPIQDENLRCLLLAALYQLVHTKAAPYAVVDHAVRAAHHLNAGSAKLTNAILRNFLRRSSELLAAAGNSDEGFYSYPQWWINKLRSQYGEHAHSVLLAGNLHPPMTLRVNCRRINPVDYLALLAKQDIPARLIDLEAITLEHPVSVEVLPGFGDGMVSVQDSGAQYATRLIDVQDNMRVLDACSAPGGKAAHLLERNDIDLIAIDKDELRLERVRGNLRRLNLSAQVKVGDATEPDRWWDGKPFQRILADVPCSGSGVVRRHPDIKWLRRPEDIVGFSQQQLRILVALWQLLESNGKLLYVTCSVFKQENQEVIEKFICLNNNARQLPLNLSGLNQGQLLPDDQHDGFYYALLQKQA